MKGKYLSLFVFVVLLSLSTLDARTFFVKFDGEWKENTTLFSKWYSVDKGWIWGKDVYPIRKPWMNKREKVCYAYNKTRYKRVCRENTDGYRIVRRYVCRRRGLDYKIECEWIEKKIPTKRKWICERIPYQKQYKKCRWITKNRVKIGCMNPNGVYTNQLSLENFKYTLDEVNWFNIPYPQNKLELTNTTIKFRLDIPAECSPKYKYNRAIRIRLR